MAFWSKPQMNDFKINLGDEVKCKITGFTGVVFTRSQWLHGCNTYGLKSRELREGKPQDLVWFDEPALELIAGKQFEPKRNTGGPTIAVPQTNR